MPSSFHSLFLSLLAILLAGASHAAPFVVPMEGNPPFRRDLLPIDTDSMTTLSEDLSLLSHLVPLGTAENRRAAAQTLALALALDPGNSSARETLAAITEGEILSTPLSRRVTSAKARIWQIHAWLNTPEAGVNGKLLADMLGDTAAVLDKENPISSELANAPERGKWEGIVAPLSAFEDGALVENDPSGEKVDPFKDIDPDMPEEDLPDVKPSGILLKEADLTSVFQVEKERKRTFRLVPIAMNAIAREGGGGEDGKSTFKVNVPGESLNQREIDKFIAAPIRDALEKLHGTLPAAGSVTIEAGRERSYSITNNGDSLSGPGFVLANAAISGREPGGLVIARLDAETGVAIPEFFWRMLSELPEGEGGRLVIPKGSEDYFLAILVLEKPDFFLKYEVLVASNLEELIEFSAAKPSEKNAATYAKFAEIKAKAEGNPIGAYLANRFVRQKLEEIAAEAPHHLSAKALALQGAGERPRSLTKKVLAAEVWRAIDPIASIATLDAQQIDSERVTALEKIYENTRAEVDRLERYADLRDRELVTEGASLAVAVRTLTRAMRSRTDDTVKRLLAIRDAQKVVVDLNKKLVAKLSEISGDPLPDELLERVKKRNR